MEMLYAGLRVMARQLVLLTDAIPVAEPGLHLLDLSALTAHDVLAERDQVLMSGVPS